MSDFSTRIDTIKRDLDSLTSTLTQVDSKLKAASDDFKDLSENADSISKLSTAVQRLARFFAEDRSPFLAELRDKIGQISKELDSLDVSKLSSTTQLLEANGKAIAAISRAQANVTSNINKTKEALVSLKTAVDSLDANDSGASLKEKLGSIAEELQRLNNIKQLSFVSELNKLDPARYNQAADALDRVSKLVQTLKNANISIDVSAASEADKLTKRPIQPIVKQPVTETEIPAASNATPQQSIKARPRTIQYAQQNGIDLSQVTGTGARGIITKEDVDKLVQQNKSNAPAIDVGALQSQLEQKILDSIGIDKVLEQLQQARERAFKAALSEHRKLTSDQKLAAFKYLVPEEGLSPAELAGRREDFKEVNRNREGPDLDVLFRSKLQKQSISTEGLPPEFANLSADDTKLIDQLKAMRDALSRERKKLADQINKTQESGDPRASFATDVTDATTSFSKNVYRPISYGSELFGTILNSITQIFKGIQTGGPGGILDALGGGLKGINAIGNANAYFGLNILPKPFGEFFQPKRSQTLLDLAEVFFGATTGFGRSPIDRTLTGYKSQESTLASKKDALKDLIEGGTITDPQALTKLQAEFLKVTEELKELRSKINAYSKVIADQAAQKAEATKNNSLSVGKQLEKGITPYGAVPATGGTQEQTVVTPEAKQSLRNRVEAFLTEQDKQLTRIATQALKDFSQGTGFEQKASGVLAVSAGTGDKIGVYQGQRLPDAQRSLGLNAVDRVTGESVPVVKVIGKEYQQGQNAASVAIHEIIHSIIDDIQKSIIAQLGSGSTGRLALPGLEEARRSRFKYLSTEQGRGDLLEAAQDNATDYGHGLLTALSQKDNSRGLDYYFNPEEIFAHIGESLVRPSTELADTLKVLYGQDLYEQVAAALKSEAPNAFSDEALAVLKPRFEQLRKEFDDLGNLKAPRASFATDVQQVVTQVADAFGIQGPLGHIVNEVVQVAQNAAQGVGNFAKSPPSYLGLLGQVLTPGSASFSRIAGVARDEFLPTNISKLIGSIQSQGGNAFLGAAGRAITSPNAANISAAVAAGQDLSVKNIAIDYVRSLFRDLKLPGGYLTEIIRETGIPNALAQKGVEAIVDKIAQSAGPNEATGRVVGRIAGIAIGRNNPNIPSFQSELDDRIIRQTGARIQAGSYSQQAIFDPVKGITTFAIQAKTADGAIVNLNAHLDEFGRKKIEDPAHISQLKQAVEEFFRAIPRNLGYRFTESITTGFQEMSRKIISVQDELSEVASLYGKVGEEATKVKASFLSQSVNTAISTGQGFDEAIQTNLKNFKILGNIKPANVRDDLANQLSTIQLGSQTAFGISLDQSLEAVPAILASIKNGFDDIPDPVDKTRASMQELSHVFDQIVAAQRATGAQGSDLITVYSRLSESAKEYGLSSRDLLTFVASAAPAIGKGSDETSNIFRSFFEGTYSEANQSAFAKAGISTKAYNAQENRFENRSTLDVARDLYRLSQDQSQSIEYNQLLQSIAGPKLKPDIAKLIAGFGRNEQDVGGAIDQTPQGLFQQVVGTKSANIAGSLNKLNAAGTQLFGSVLVNTGALDTATKLLDTFAQSAIKLTDFINEHSDIIKGFFNLLSSPIKNNIIGQFAKDFNLFGPIAGLIGRVETTISAGLTGALKTAQENLLGLGNAGDKAGGDLLRTFRLVGAVVNEMADAAAGATGNVASGLKGIAAAANGIRPSQVFGRLSEEEPTTPDSLKNAVRSAAAQEAESTALRVAEENAARASFATQAQGRNAKQGLLGFVGGAAEEIGNSENLPVGQSRIVNYLNKKFNFAQVGDVAGSVAAPAAFDLITGGISKDNIVNTAGAAIAGTFLGILTASPQLGIIGYTMAKSFLDTVDLAGVFGTSDKERAGVAKSIIGPGLAEQKTPEQQEVEKKILDQGILEFKKITSLDDFVNKQVNINTRGYRGTSTAGQLAVSSQDISEYQRLVVNNQGSGFFDFLKKQGLQNNQPVQALYNLLSQNPVLLERYKQAGVSNLGEYQQIVNEAATGKGAEADKLKELGYQQYQQDQQIQQTNAQKQAQVSFENAQDIIAKAQQAQTDAEKRINDRYSVPYGTNTYNSFSGIGAQLQQQYAETFAKINSGQLTGKNAENAIAQLDRAAQSLQQLPATLQQLIPLAQGLGLNTTGLEQRLYNSGAEGQSTLLQRFAPAVEADKFTKQYEAQQARLRTLQASDTYRTKDPTILKEVEAIQKALSADKQRYDINKALIETLKGQTNVLLDQAGAIEKQTKTRQLLSAGTPAQFTPASIFDTKGLTAVEINNAIDFALRKQRQLEKLNPEYAKEFAKDQFLLQSGTNFKGVTGVNQSFVQEYLQQQQQQKQAPLEDLSKYSDQELQRILDQARSLQSQAEKLDPSRAGKYDNERILILRKNNELLAQTGIGQEFLKAALDANTKSNDTLRGHYNLPSNYKSPTIWDYYANGGTERGDQNFPNQMGNGLVPLSFAQQLAQQLANPSNGEKGADLSAIAGTSQPGARPLFYPNPGTGAVYSDITPETIPDSIPEEQNISKAVQRFIDFKLRQIDDLDKAANGGASKGGVPPQKDADLLPALPNGPRRRDNSFYNDGFGGGGGKGWGDTREVASDLKAAGESGTLVNKAFKDASVNLDNFTGTMRDGKAETSGLVSGLKASAEASKTFGQSVPGAISSLNTGATAFAQVIQNVQQKLLSFDFAAALKNANLTLQVTINGQTLTANAGDIKITNANAGGTSTLSAGSGAKSGSRGI
jgi:hypothetical protein